MKKLIYFLAFVLIVNCTLKIDNCEGQWVKMKSFTYFANCFASIGDNIFAGFDFSGVYRSTNNGVNWIQVGLDSLTVSSLATIGNNLLAGVAGPGAGVSGVLLSTNNGANWIRTSLTYSVSTLTINGNNIYAGTGDGIYLSSNNGTSWTTLTTTIKYINSLCVRNNDIFAGTSFISNTKGIFLSTDNGNLWSQTNISISSTSEVNSLISLVRNTPFAENIIFAGIDTRQIAPGNIYYTTNNGVNWFPTTLSKSIYSTITYYNTIIAGTFSYGVYISQDFGGTWIPENQGFGNGVGVDCLFITNNYIFAGFSREIWRRPLSEIITGVQNICTEIPSRYLLNQNFPNPFNPTTTIKFDIAVDSRLHGNDKVVLKVFDILGKEVATLVNEQLAPGTYSADWNASAFPSGVYFYRLTTDGFSETKKMLLIK